MKNLLETRNLTVEIDGKQVVRDVNLKIKSGEIHALMGPNGCGKTTLSMAIIGHPACKISGKLFFEGKDISKKDISERAKMGIAIAYQHSPEIPGVKLRDLIRRIMNKEPWNPLLEPEEKVASPYLARVGLNPAVFLRRDINVGFSGGERKRSELAQILAMKPKLMILDEIDSGVDIDSLQLIGEELNRAIEETGSAALVITHYRHILQYLKPTIVHIMYNGQIISSDSPENILSLIEKKGYEGYIKSIKEAKEWRKR
jgi:Fe-S cluster assembly ATP-binding protein